MAEKAGTAPDAASELHVSEGAERNEISRGMVAACTTYPQIDERVIYLFGSQQPRWLDRAIFLSLLGNEEGSQCGAYRHFMFDPESGKPILYLGERGGVCLSLHVQTVIKNYVDE